MNKILTYNDIKHLVTLPDGLEAMPRQDYEFIEYPHDRYSLRDPQESELKYRLMFHTTLKVDFRNIPDCCIRLSQDRDMIIWLGPRNKLIINDGSGISIGLNKDVRILNYSGYHITVLNYKQYFRTFVNDHGMKESRNIQKYSLIGFHSTNFKSFVENKMVEDLRSKYQDNIYFHLTAF